jgi:hypothetical protein
MIPTLTFIGVAIMFEYFAMLIGSRDSEPADEVSSVSTTVQMLRAAGG